VISGANDGRRRSHVAVLAIKSDRRSGNFLNAVEPYNPGTLELLRLTLLRSEYNTPINERHLAVHVLQLIGRDGVRVAIPHREIGVLADFDRADAILEKHRPCRPRRVRTKSGSHVDRFRRAERFVAVGAVQCLTGDR
jgi:hypothetical protein